MGTRIELIGAGVSIRSDYGTKYIDRIFPDDGIFKDIVDEMRCYGLKTLDFDHDAGRIVFARFSDYEGDIAIRGPKTESNMMAIRSLMHTDETKAKLLKGLEQLK